MTTATIVVPCYNEEDNITTFYEKVDSILNNLSSKYGISHRYIFVDDGSIDNTAEILKQLHKEHPNNVEFIMLSRNFGKEAALYAGLVNSKSEYTAIMDADLQDPPELLDEMLQGVKNEGYDCVAARRKNRKGEPIIRSLFAKLFYWLIQKLTKLPITNGARDFRLFNKTMLENIINLKESNRFSKCLFPWVGFKTKWIEYDNIERHNGNSKWSFMKLTLYALDGITAFSSAPLIAVSVFGVISMIISILLIIFVIIRKLVYGDPVAGWPSLVCIMLFVSSLQYFFMGVLGYYIAKIYNETKNRPNYIIQYSSLQNNPSY